MARDGRITIRRAGLLVVVAASTADPAAIIITEADPPAGWSSLAVERSFTSTGGDSCLDQACGNVESLFGEAATVPNAFVGFTSPDFAVLLDDAVATEVDDPDSIVDELGPVVVACDQSTVDGVTYSLTDAAFPALGDASTAVQLDGVGEDGSATLSALVLWVAVGGVLIQTRRSARRPMTSMPTCWRT